MEGAKFMIRYYVKDLGAPGCEMWVEKNDQLEPWCCWVVMESWEDEHSGGSFCHLSMSRDCHTRKEAKVFMQELLEKKENENRSS
jgi:hypothetical protein